MLFAVMILCLYGLVGMLLDQVIHRNGQAVSLWLCRRIILGLPQDTVALIEDKIPWMAEACRQMSSTPKMRAVGVVIWPFWLATPLAIPLTRKAILKQVDMIKEIQGKQYSEGQWQEAMATLTAARPDLFN